MLSVQPLLFDARVQKEAIALRDAGHRVRIVYVEDPRSTVSIPTAAEARRALRTALAGIEVRPVVLRSREWRRLPAPIRKLAQAIELFCRFSWIILRARVDVLHSHDLTPGLFCILGRLVHGARIVYDAHELEVRAGNPILRALQAIYERFLVRLSTAVITVNEPIAGIMSRRYRRPVAVIANRPPYVRRDDLEPRRLRVAAGLPGDARIVLYVGFLARERRGIEIVARALPFLDEDVHFVIMGVGRIEEFREYLRGYAERHAVPMDRIHFVGPFPPAEVVRYISGADVSTALYREDSENNSINAPNKLFQSIMARVPILAADNRTLPKFVLDNGIGPVGEVVDPLDYRRVAEMLRVMLDPDRQRKYRQNAEALAVRVSWESEAERLVALYRDGFGAPGEDGGAPLAAAAAAVATAMDRG
ncbi:MAG TPA: glycosyltransferase [Longimicrobiales bacterium]